MEADGRQLTSRRVSIRAAALLCLPLAACGSSRSLYAWGEYEESVYAVCAEPDAIDVGREIERLVQLVKASAEAKVDVAPGVHAHLGYLYSLQGDLDSATAAFLSERELYPESTVFIDGLLARIGASTGPQQEQP
jgi:hypothetical protein